MYTLYLCATPIGNLEDITLRVLRILEEVRLIACEDTRQSRKLLNHYHIEKPLISYHEHNKHQAKNRILEHLREVGDVALITDAGMPAISDPGGDLLQEARAAGATVTVLPGPSAALTALVLSGQDASRFVFEGFLPRSGKERRLRLEEAAEERRTVVFYEAPHRLLDTLADLAAAVGDRSLSVCRELTKKFEEVQTGTAAELLAHFQEAAPRGEFVLVLAGRDEAAPSPEAAVAYARTLVRAGMHTKEAAKSAAEAFPGVSRRDIYQALIAHA